MKKVNKFKNIILTLSLLVLCLTAGFVFSGHNENVSAEQSYNLITVEYSDLTYTVLEEESAYTYIKVTAISEGLKNDIIESLNKVNLIFPNFYSEGGKNYVISEFGDNINNVFGTSVSVAEKIQNISFPIHLNSINNYAFANLSNLQVINFPSALQKIGTYAFKNTGLLSVDLSNNPDLEILNNAFEGCVNLEQVVLPLNLKLIGKETFKNCTSLNDVVLPEKLVTIGESAFYNCNSLENIDFSKCSSLKTIIKTAFYDCYSLTSVSIPSTLTSIGDKAFYISNVKNDKLETVIIGEDCEALIMGQALPAEKPFSNVKTFYIHKDNEQNWAVDGSWDYFEDGTNQYKSYPFTITYKTYSYNDNEYTNDIDQTRYVDFDNQNIITNDIIPLQILNEDYLPVLPEKTGYEFKGWYTSPTDFSDANKVNVNEFIVKDNLTLYSHYELNQHYIEVVELSYQQNIWRETDTSITYHKYYSENLDLTYLLLNQINFGVYYDKNLTLPVGSDYVVTKNEKLYVAKFSENVYNYKINADLKSYTLLGSKYNNLVNVIIPNNYNGLPVTHIGNDAFYKNPHVKFLTTESTLSNLTTIGEYAFANTNLNIASLPNSFTTFSTMAFGGINNDLNIYLSNKNIEIATYAFPLTTNVYISSKEYTNNKLAWDNKLANVSSNITLMSCAEKNISIDFSFAEVPYQYKNSVCAVLPYQNFELPEINLLAYNFVSWIKGTEDLNTTYKIIPYNELTTGESYNALLEFIYDVEVLSGGNTCIITGIKSKYNTFETLELPDLYGDKLIIGIKENAFKDNKVIKQLIIGKDIITFGNSAFRNSIIENISFKTNSGEYDLTLYQPNGYVFEEYCFANCNLKNIDFSNITTNKLVIKNNAFINNTGLSELNLIAINFVNKSQSIKATQEIDFNAFVGSGLTKITLHEFGTVIWPSATENGTLNNLSTIIAREMPNENGCEKTFKVINNVIYNVSATHLIYMPDALNGVVELPDTVTSMYENAFEFTHNLSGIKLNNQQELLDNWFIENNILYKQISGSWLLWHLPSKLNITELTINKDLNGLNISNIAKNALRYNNYLKYVKLSEDFIPVYNYNGTDKNIITPNLYANIIGLQLNNNVKEIVKNNFANIKTLKTIEFNVNDNFSPLLTDKSNTDDYALYFGESVESLLIKQSQSKYFNAVYPNCNLLTSSLKVELKSNIGENLPVVLFNLGEAPLLSNPTKYGYNFENWYTDQALTQVYVSQPLYSNLTLYAKYSLQKFTVTYLVDNEVYSVSQVDYQKTVGDIVTPNKKGFIFVSWLDEYGNEFDKNTPITKDINLTAKFVTDKEYVTKQVIGYVAIALGALVLIVIIVVFIFKQKEKKLLKDPNNQNATKTNKKSNKKKK